MNNQLRDNFRQSMRRLTATVCVITCQHKGVRYGITATAVTSLCFDPVSVLACINSTSSLLQPLLACRKYCINLLSHQHTGVSHHFSTPRPSEERFAAGEWLSNAQRIPYLADAQATLFCRLEQTIAYATHHIVIGQVSDCQFSETIAPLLYQNGEYVTSTPLPTTVAG